jgi:hypothetical protein
MRKKLTVHRKSYTRKAYSRKGYKRSDGTYVKPAKVGASRVPASTFKIKDVGAKGRGKKLFKVKKGLLTKYGYHVDKSAKARHMALKKADKAYGSVRLWRMLNAQALFRKRTNGLGKMFTTDRNWVKRELVNKKEARSMTAPAVKKWESLPHSVRARLMPSRK